MIPPRAVKMGPPSPVPSPAPTLSPRQSSCRFPSRFRLSHPREDRPRYASPDESASRRSPIPFAESSGSAGGLPSRKMQLPEPPQGSVHSSLYAWASALPCLCRVLSLHICCTADISPAPGCSLCSSSDTPSLYTCKSQFIIAPLKNRVKHRYEVFRHALTRPAVPAPLYNGLRPS